MIGPRDVSVVIVTHDSAGIVGRALASVRDAGEILVVDNASADDTPGTVARAAPGARVVSLSTNTGFAYACNAGLAAASRPFVLFLNPDAALEPGALQALLDAAARYPNAALIGPSILRPDGAVEPSHDLGLFARIAAGARRDAGEAPAGDLSAEFLSGAVLLGRVAALRAVGGFDPDFLLYFEDDDLCWRLRAMGWTLVRAAAARARHAGGASAPPSPARERLKRVSFGWSRLHFEAKHRDETAFARTALRLISRHVLRAIGNAVLLRGARRDRNLWTALGMSARLRGVSARDAVGLTRPEGATKSAAS